MSICFTGICAWNVPPAQSTERKNKFGQQLDPFTVTHANLTVRVFQSFDINGHIYLVHFSEILVQLMPTASSRRRALLATFTTLLCLFAAPRAQRDLSSRLSKDSGHRTSGATLAKTSTFCEDFTGPCEITLLIVVLTATRYRSLDLLLSSLSSWLPPGLSGCARRDAR